MKKMYIVLEDGHIFEGKGLAADKNAIGELVFTTGVVGYIETLTDKAYYGQIVMHTFPLIGNYGMINEDAQSEKPVLSGYIARELCDAPSNFRTDCDLPSYLNENGIVSVCDVDTREITKLLRENGVMNAVITDDPDSVDFEALKAYKIKDALKAVADNKTETFKADDEKYKVTVLNLGAMSNIVSELTKRGCTVTVVPYNTSAQALLSSECDGIVISNGPGDPADNTEITENIKAILGKKPVFSIGLGHQLTALAQGAKTYKLKYGHRGASQPVKDLSSGKVFATGQNHGYTVDFDSLDSSAAKLTYINVNDKSCEGIDYPSLNAFGIQFSPEVFSETVSTDTLYDKFIELMGGNK